MLRFPEFLKKNTWEENILNEYLELLTDFEANGSFADVKENVTIYDKPNFAWYVRATDLENNSSLAKVKYVGKHSYEFLRKTSLFGGELLISKRGEIGKVFFFMTKENTPATVAPNLYLLKMNEKAIPKFFYYFFISSNGNQSLRRLNASSTIGALYKDDVKNIVLYVPSPKEQQKIASCLSSLDELITAQSQKLEALKAHKKGLMQQLFPGEGETVPKLRFAEFRNSGEWEEISLIDVADKNVKWSFTGGPFGSNLKASDYVTNGIRVIQLQNIGDGEFSDNYKIFTSKHKADELLSCNIYPGDIILSKMGDPVGRACLIPNTNDRYVMCSDGIRLVVNETQYSKYFIFVLINSTQFRPLVEKNATGSTRKRIGLDNLKSLPMIVPTNLCEQQKIASCLSSLDELIKAQTEKTEALKVHKKGLMQQLFPNTNDISK